MGEKNNWALVTIPAILLIIIMAVMGFVPSATAMKQDNNPPCQTKIITSKITLVNGQPVVKAESEFNDWMKENYEKVEVISINPIGNAYMVTIVIVYKNKQ